MSYKEVIVLLEQAIEILKKEDGPEGAMRRYTAKLKEELHYAKQEQSEGEQTRETSSERSEILRDQSNSSICK